MRLIADLAAKCADEYLSGGGDLRAPDELREIITRVFQPAIEGVVNWENEIQQVLGKALGYPRYADDQKTFPGATGDEVCVGEHVAVTLADEAAARLRRLADIVRRLREAVGDRAYERYTSDLFGSTTPSYCDLEAENAKLREGAGWCYQFAGIHDASVDALDNLAALASGLSVPHEWPVIPVPADDRTPHVLAVEVALLERLTRAAPCPMHVWAELERLRTLKGNQGSACGT